MHTNQPHSLNCNICGQDGCTEHAAPQADASVTSATPPARKRTNKTADAATKSEAVEDRRELTQRDRSILTRPQGYLMVASPVDIS